MKYIPLESFEAINSLLQAVEALGCLVTIRLEAFTCRHTREERQIATNLAQYYTDVQSTPPISPSPMVASAAGAFGDAVELPPPMVLGGSIAPSYGGGASEVSGATDARLAQVQGTPVITAQDIDERLVFMVAALNGMYEKDGYDFSVLTERDFATYTLAQLQDEVNQTLGHLPESSGPAVQQFWPAIQEQVGDAAHGCEVFEFRCPSCDPRRETSVFSNHFFLYCKPRKILVSLLIYGEGNRYRGDDGYVQTFGEFGFDDEHESPRNYASSPDPFDDDIGNEEEGGGGGEYAGKNRDYYGF